MARVRQKELNAESGPKVQANSLPLTQTDGRPRAWRKGLKAGSAPRKPHDSGPVMSPLRGSVSLSAEWDNNSADHCYGAPTVYQAPRMAEPTHSFPTCLLSTYHSECCGRHWGHGREQTEPKTLHFSFHPSGGDRQ